MLQEYPDILTPKEVMEILDVGKNLLYALLKDGVIPAKRVGDKMWRIAKKDLIHYISETNWILNISQLLFCYILYLTLILSSDTIIYIKALLLYIKTEE